MKTSRTKNPEKIRQLLNAGCRLHPFQQDILDREYAKEMAQIDAAEKAAERKKKAEFEREHPVIGYRPTPSFYGIGGIFQDSYGQNDIMVPLRRGIDDV